MIEIFDYLQIEWDHNAGDESNGVEEYGMRYLISYHFSISRVIL